MNGTLQAATNALHKNTVQILFLGDSLTEGYRLPQEKSYPSVVEKVFAENGYPVKVINAGISGDTSIGGLNRLRWYVKNNTYPDTDILFVALGANDGLRGLPPEKLYANLREIILLGQKQKMKIVLAGLHIPPNYGRVYTTAFDNVYLRLKKEFPILFIPFLLDGVAGDHKLNLDDGIHPNAKGYEAVAQIVFNALQPLIKNLSS